MNWQLNILLDLVESILLQLDEVTEVFQISYFKFSISIGQIKLSKGNQLSVDELPASLSSRLKNICNWISQTHDHDWGQL